MLVLLAGSPASQPVGRRRGSPSPADGRRQRLARGRHVDPPRL